MLAGAGGRPEPGQTEQTANSGRGWVGRGTRRSKCLRRRDSLQLAEAARGCWTEQHLSRPLSHRLRAMAQNISPIINNKIWNLTFCAGKCKIKCILFSKLLSLCRPRLSVGCPGEGAVFIYVNLLCSLISGSSKLCDLTPAADKGSRHSYDPSLAPDNLNWKRSSVKTSQATMGREKPSIVSSSSLHGYYSR